MAFFDAFGYLYIPGYLYERIDRITSEFEAVWESHGTAHDVSSRSVIVPFVDQSEYFSTLLEYPHIHDIVASLCGKDFNYRGSDGNLYIGETRWHSDAYADWDILHVKFAFYLDPLTRDTRALRVIPGSHRVGEAYADGLEQHIRKSAEAWGISGRQVPALALEATPADLVVFDFRLKYGAFGGSQRRRMCTINVSRRYPEERLAELRRLLADEARYFFEHGTPIRRAYGEAMIRTAGPERMLTLEQQMANDGHIAKLTRQLEKEHSNV